MPVVAGSYFTWDSHKFPSPEEMIRNVTSRGRKMVTIIDPHIKRDPNYFVHSDATANGYYVKDRDGNDFDGQWRPALAPGRGEVAPNRARWLLIEWVVPDSG